MAGAVSIHAPARGATRTSLRSFPCRQGFNPRTREGCDERRYRAIKRNKLFQSTHPRGVRPEVGPGVALVGVFQSTHPRGVRRVDFVLTLHAAGVSIHAPARGATALIRTSGISRLVSIHAPARGATLPKTTSPSESKFQSTHPRGVRRNLRCDQATARRFNPRTREGCDLTCRLFLFHREVFQSTHPRGVRLPKYAGTRINHVFYTNIRRTNFTVLW